MSDTPVDTSKRTWLIASGCAGAAGGVAVAVPFVSSFQPSEKAKAAGAAVEVDISALQPGEKLTVEWRGKPVWILKRTPEQIASLAKTEPQLADPKSDRKTYPTPEYAKNQHRSIKPEIFVGVGICTHLGCSPTFRPEVAPADLGKDWVGGYFCPCHGSHYDLAGRVYKAQPAPLNLPVPPYYYETDNIVVVGLDGENA